MAGNTRSEEQMRERHWEKQKRCGEGHCVRCDIPTIPAMRSRSFDKIWVCLRCLEHLIIGQSY